MRRLSGWDERDLDERRRLDNVLGWCWYRPIDPLLQTVGVQPQPPADMADAMRFG
jgi:hypothetical protein